MQKETSIGKWGNSFAVRIPKEILDQVHLHLKDSLSLSVQDGAIVLKPKERKATLEELLEGYQASEAVDWGVPQGREEW